MQTLTARPVSKRLHPGLGGDFTPGVERARKAGYTIEVHPYVGTGDEQVQESLTVIAKKIRDGRLDPDIRGWVGDVLKAAENPKTRAGKVAAILDAFRQSTIYVSDPVGAEYIVAAGTTMCLRPGLCVRARDCDDGVVAVGSACMAAGIPGYVVKQNFGPGKQEHVLWEAILEDGSLYPADPSTSLPAGDKVPAVSEERVDPMEVVGSAGTSGPEIVTLGALPLDADLPDRPAVHKNEHGEWTVQRYGQWWIHGGAGVGWVPVGAGDACCAACAEKDAGGAGASGAQGDPPYPAPAGKQWVWGRGCTEPGGGIVPGWGLIDAPTGTGSKSKPDDGTECSACEMWAKRNAEELEAKLGVSGPSSKTTPKKIPTLSFVARLRDGRLGLGSDVPGGTTPLVVPPPPATPAPPSASGPAIVGVGAAIAIAAGIGWGLYEHSKRRRAA